MAIQSILDVVWESRRALVRVDFNVPLNAAGEITDDSRMASALPTLRHLLGEGASLVVMSHLGRPQGTPDPRYSLKPVATHLATLLDRPVALEEVSLTSGPGDAASGEVLMLENTRFLAGETANDAETARLFSRYGDVYVNDAFGSLHRAHASTVGVTQHLPAVAGLLVNRELTYLTPLVSGPKPPALAILGGAKISDKIGIIQNLLEHMDAILIGGGMANTFFRAQGHDVGGSLYEEEALPEAARLLEVAGDRLQLPVDVHAAVRFSAEAERAVVTPDAIPEGWMALDIGPATIAHFANRLAGAATVFWNGPMGVAEMPPFDRGTHALADCLATLSNATTVVGGGDSAAAVHQAGMADAFSHVSTGGGACLEYLAGHELPGLTALESAR